jgi:hypothetical protein
MGFYKYTALALLALRAVGVFAADAVSPCSNRKIFLENI